MPACVGRLTISDSSSGGGGVSPFATAASCSALAFASSIADSKAMARSTAGSPTTFNKPNESRAATKPTIIPRHNKDPVVIAIILNASSRRRRHETLGAAAQAKLIFPDQDSAAGVQIQRTPSVAGEAEQMAAVVHEFMHVHALDDRSRAFLRADEIDAEQANKAGENDPGKQFANWDRSGPRGGGSKCRSCSYRTPWGYRVPVRDVLRRGKCLTLGRKGPITVARPCRTCTGFHPTTRLFTIRALAALSIGLSRRGSGAADRGRGQVGAPPIELFRRLTLQRTSPDPA